MASRVRESTQEPPGLFRADYTSMTSNQRYEALESLATAAQGRLKACLTCAAVGVDFGHEWEAFQKLVHQLLGELQKVKEAGAYGRKTKREEWNPGTSR